MRARSFWVWTIAIVSAATLLVGTSYAEGYGLDTVSREAVTKRGRLICPKVPMVRYRGTAIRYHSKLFVYKGFAERLKRFERVVARVAKRVYGRLPLRIRHMGTFNCRRVGGYPKLLSEHAFGNGIDISGFTFGPARGKQVKGLKLPASLRKGFRVNILKHWGKKRGVARYHARFLDELARELVANKTIFRVMLGPGYPGHKDHFHFDMAPYRLVKIW